MCERMCERDKEREREREKDTVSLDVWILSETALPAKPFFSSRERIKKREEREGQYVYVLSTRAM